MEIGNFGFSGSGGGGGGLPPIVGGGTLNYIAKYTPNGTTINNSLLFDNGTSVGLGTITPDASAILELSSTTQGFAAPRMTTLQRDAIVAPVVSLLIFNTSSGFYNYWDGVSWVNITSGGLIGANNGLTVSGSDVQLGGTLIQPTTIDALGVNTLSINDQTGLFMQTRDANSNFFFNNIGGTGTLVGSSRYVFSYLGDGGNVFEDTFIVINFGGANYIKGGTDFWNFGDYTVADGNSSIFNFGRFNEINNSTNIFMNGYTNTLNSLVGSFIFGNQNVLSNCTNIGVFGSNNSYTAISDLFIIGNNNGNLFIDGVNGNVGVGVSNILAKTHIFGRDATTEVILRLEPVTDVTEDTSGNTVNTTDATVTQLEVLEIPINTVVMIESCITCRKTAGAGVGTIGEGNSYIRTVKAQNIAGVVTIGVIQSSFTSESISVFDVTFTIGGTDVVLYVTGDINDDVTWNSITKKYIVG